MSSLFRSLNNFSNKRENAIKEAIINALTENVTDVQFEYKQNPAECLEMLESFSALCTTLEAMFLHGLKDSFLWQTLNVIVARDEENRPEPSFWSPLMVFLHKQVIEQIQSQTQITSEIGQCRAWIRLSLNESLFSSYLSNMRKNSSALNPYYHKYALVKDSDGMKMASKLINDLDEMGIEFNLPFNSSLLNQWPDYALQLSGLWTPSLKSCPISSGIDVAGAISVTGTATAAIPTPQPLRTNELFSESISNSPFNQAPIFAATEDLTQREHLDVFLKKIDEEDHPQDSERNDSNATTAQLREQHNTVSKKGNIGKGKRKHLKNLSVDAQLAKNNATIESDISSPITSPNTLGGNSLASRMQTSWSDDGNSGANTSTCTTPVPSDDESSRRNSWISRHSLSTVSFPDILRKHERNRNIDWTTLWEKFMSGMPSSADQLSDVDDNEAVENSSDEHRTASVGSDYVIVPHSGLDKFNIDEFKIMVEQLCNLSHESGLDGQGFVCKSCSHPLSIGSELKVCAFSGFYYCDNCIEVEAVLIPAKIIYNWDFRKYIVSKRAALFMSELHCEPLLDLELLNPDIYEASEAMAELQSLRIRLNFLRAYFYTCCLKETKEDLQRMFFGKEYLCETIHKYSISDLSMLTRGILNQQLQRIYKIAEAHVLKCPLCSLKGFICEICKSARVLYPFHIDTTYHCATCGAVFHAECINNQQPCPKCQRISKRENLATPENLIAIN